jgi:hypothetical protein
VEQSDEALCTFVIAGMGKGFGNREGIKSRNIDEENLFLF